MAGTHFEGDAPKGIRITVEDLETGETATREIWNDYFILCAGNHYVDGVTKYGNGTTQLTIKVDRGGL